MISIVIPCFNAVSTIAATIQSALAQDLDREVIVVDDGSTDSSGDIIRSFGEQVISRFQPNRGVSAARNAGVSLARGEWIQFLDSDDLLLPGALGLSLDVAEKQDADVVFSRWLEFSETGGLKTVLRERVLDERFVSDDPQIAFATDAWVPPVAVLYRRNLVEQIGGFRADLPIIQDARFLFDAGRCGGRLAFAEHVGGYYRVQLKSLSRRNPVRFWQDIFHNAMQIEALWRSDGQLPSERRRALHSIYRHCAQGFVAGGDDEAFAAFAACKRFGEPPFRLTLALGLARLIGTGTAPAVLARLSR